MTDPTPTPELPKIHLDFGAFTGAEAMAAQREFECDWTDLTSYVAGKILGTTRRQTAQKLLDSKGRVRYADEVLRWLIWTVWRRDNPTVDRGQLDAMVWADLLGLLEPAEGKAGPARLRSKTT